MFFDFFGQLRAARIPVSLNEYLVLMEAMEHGIAAYSVDDFYRLSRATLVKDERHLDKFDVVFGHCFKGLEAGAPDIDLDLPEEWLRRLTERLPQRAGQSGHRSPRRMGRADRTSA